MSLHNQITRHARLPLQTVNILRETLEQQTLVRKQAQEGVRYRRPIPPRVELVRERVERDRVLAEIRNVKDGLRVGQIEAGKIGVEASVRRAEVWDAG